MKRYQAYKDSGVSWIGEIPVDWSIKKLKYYTTTNDEVLTENTAPNYEFRYVDIGSVTLQNGIEHYQGFSFEDAPSRARRIVRTGDVIVSTVRTYLKAVASIQDDKDVIASTGFAVIRPKEVDSRFLAYYQEFQRYIKKMGYENELGILIAFSGTVRDGGEEYTEVSLNGIKESELPEKFHGGEYQVLLVAEKYQTGFDEPLLHTMFVDKKLSGVKAVQTLSRLNRTCFGKEDTFVLDFVNSAEDIRAAFAPYYEETTIEETTDANIVYELKSKLDEFRVYWASEIESFAKVFFKPSKKQGNMDFGVLNSFLDPAVDRYKGLEENEQEEFKSTLTKFVRAYTFLTNIIRLDDADLHKFHAYAKFLQKKLPKREGGGQVFLDDEVALQYYRVQKIFEGSIALEQSDPLPNKIHPGKPKPEEEKAPLSELIDKINEKFGTEFTNIDKVLEQIVSDMDANEELRIQARNNSQEHFRFPFNDAFMDVVIGRMAQNQQFCERVLDDAKFGDTVRDLLIGVVYDRLRQKDAQRPI